MIQKLSEKLKNDEAYGAFNANVNFEMWIFCVLTETLKKHFRDVCQNYPSSTWYRPGSLSSSNSLNGCNRSRGLGISVSKSEWYESIEDVELVDPWRYRGLTGVGAGVAGVWDELGEMWLFGREYSTFGGGDDSIGFFDPKTRFQIDFNFTLKPNDSASLIA